MADGDVSPTGWVRRVLSHDCGPFWQFVKYGVVGVLATLVQMAVFYLLAATCLRCLKSDDWAVRLVGLPAVDIGDGLRALRFYAATGIGFVFANIFCWLMNRRFVFRPGKFRWYAELGMFFAASGAAMVLATTVSAFLIRVTGLMTSAAVLIEIVLSFVVNFMARKFFIFKG